MNMNDNNMYEIRYNGRTFLLEKSGAAFEHGYAVVETRISESQDHKKEFNDDISIKGVIDENFNTVIDFHRSLYKTNIFPEGNILLIKRIKFGDGEDAYYMPCYHHYKINDGKAECIAEFPTNDCEFINDTTMKIKNRNSGVSFVSLYDILKADFISDKFTTIDYFNIINFETEERIAKAILKIKADDNSNEMRNIYCYINDKGKIRTPLYNSYNGAYIETNTSDFNFEKTVESIKNDVDSESIGQAVNNYLLKELRRK